MWINSLKKHITDEISSSPELKAFFLGLVDNTSQDNPETFLSVLANKINNAGQFRSRELAKFVYRILGEYRNYKQEQMTTEQCLALLNDIVLQRR